MIELHGRTDLFPAGGCVAGLASSLKASFVRIRVAIGARLEFDAAIFHCFIRTGREMAFFTCDLAMHSRKWILGFGMIELLGLLPVRDVMATLAIRAELPFVHVLMATRAVL